MGGGMGGGMGGNRAPSPKRQLTTLVRKLELLTGDIAVKLTPDQSAAIAALVADLAKTEKLSDDEAIAKYEALRAILSDDQKAKEEAIGLPFRRPAGGGGGGFGGGLAGGGDQNPDANPFQEAENAAALKSLHGRVAPQDASAAPPSSESGGNP